MRHVAVERGLLGLGSFNLRLARMKTHSALSGFQASDLPVMDAKLNFLAAQLDPDVHEQRLERVIALADLPDVDPDPDVRDVELSRLLEITADPEVVRFRSWLRGIDSLADDDVRDEIHKIRDMVGRAVRSSPGKAVRLAVTTGLGITLPPAGVALGALDTFATERLLAEPGPTAFLSRLYPSIYDKSD